MKKILFLAMMAAMTTTIKAEDYQYLTVKTNSAEKSITLATVQKITFDTAKGLVLVTTSEGTVEFPQSEMQKMFFSATPTAIEKMPAKSEALQTNKGVLEVKGNGLLRIYSSNGTLVQMAKVEEGANISLKSLPKGIYIVNMGEQTIKINK